MFTRARIHVYQVLPLIALELFFIACGNAAPTPQISAPPQQANASTTTVVSPKEHIAVVSSSSDSYFTNTPDPVVQTNELVSYVQANELPSRLTELDLLGLRKVSQFTDIDSSPSGYGKNACGLVAAAAALGGEDWTPLVKQIAEGAGNNYDPAGGIQPTPYVAALKKVFGADVVNTLQQSTLGELYENLQAGSIIIVDMKVNANTDIPGTTSPNFAHFARVLGMDSAKQEIYVQNTLDGDPYWTLSFTDFVKTWQMPELSATLKPDAKTESVTRWAVILHNAAVGERTGTVRN